MIWRRNEEEERGGSEGYNSELSSLDKHFVCVFILRVGGCERKMRVKRSFWRVEESRVGIGGGWWGQA